MEHWESNLMIKNVDIRDWMLTVMNKAWETVGVDAMAKLNADDKEHIVKTINDFDPFFEGRVRDHQVLMYIPHLDDLGRFSIKWWQDLIDSIDLPISLQFTDIYNISYYFNRLKVDAGWYLFTKIIPKSTNKSWDEQRQLLRSGYRVPNINELVTYMIMSHLGGIENENKDILARTVDDIYGAPLCVGQVIHKRINVVCEDDAQELKDNVGIYACKKII